jgi:hypothetical protein
MNSDATRRGAGDAQLTVVAGTRAGMLASNKDAQAAGSDGRSRCLAHVAEADSADPAALYGASRRNGTAGAPDASRRSGSDRQGAPAPDSVGEET